MPDSVEQVVRAEAGYAYGAVGADIHVFGDGTPLYLLFAHRRVSGLDPQWQRAQPSRMLDARAEVVDFTGRDAELAELAEWRDTGPRFRVRWLHGEGGQGKTRLANQLAAYSQPRWKVVDAAHRTDAHPPAEGSQDLRLDGHKGVLLLVDYADRWPLSDLSWLFHNRLLRGTIPARVLLIGRSASGWPSLRGKLDKLRENIDTSEQELKPLPVDDNDYSRDRMFAAARDSFARRYPEVAQPEAIAPQGPLSHPDFGLTLAVHMAALVAVDATACGRRPPADMIGLTVYLLDREHENWRQLYENADGGLDYRTPDVMMARAVFIASLAGPADRETAYAILKRVVPGASAEQILSDHGVCYPATDPGRANTLEPLLPDRLAEDFVALTVPGHMITGYCPDPWATGIPRALLTGADAPSFAPRAVTLLAAAADRWPHVGEQLLYPLLRAWPGLALDAGSAALTTLAAIRDVDMTVLEAVEEAFPETARFNLDVGVADVVERLAHYRLATVTDPTEQARVLNVLGFRRANAGRWFEAAEASGQAVDLYSSQDDHVLPDLAMAVRNHAAWLARIGIRDLALAYSGWVVDLDEKLAALSKTHLPGLAISVGNHVVHLQDAGRWPETLKYSKRTIELYETLVAVDRDVFLPMLAAAIGNHAITLAKLGRPETLYHSKQAVERWYELARVDRDAYLPDLAQAVNNHANRLDDASRSVESTEQNPEQAVEMRARILALALRYSDQAVKLREELVEANPDAYRPLLTASLSNHANKLGKAGRVEALGYSQRAVELSESLVAVDRGAYLPDLAQSLGVFAYARTLLGTDLDAAAGAGERSVEYFHELATEEPTRFTNRLRTAVGDLIGVYTSLGRMHEVERLQRAFDFPP